MKSLFVSISDLTEAEQETNPYHVQNLLMKNKTCCCIVMYRKRLANVELRVEPWTPFSEVKRFKQMNLQATRNLQGRNMRTVSDYNRSPSKLTSNPIQPQYFNLPHI